MHDLDKNVNTKKSVHKPWVWPFIKIKKGGKSTMKNVLRPLKM